MGCRKRQNVIAGTITLVQMSPSPKTGSLGKIGRSVMYTNETRCTAGTTVCG
jgi:hypothetical protein